MVSSSRAPRSVEGWRNLDIARASIWRNPFPRQVEMLADLVEGAWLSAVEAEAQTEDLPLALVQRHQHLADLTREQRGGRRLERRYGRSVLDNVAELGVTVLAQRLRQRERLGSVPEDLDHLFLFELEVGGELRRCRAAAKLSLEAASGLRHPGQQVPGMHRQAHGAARISDPTRYCLTDPPSCICRKFEALAPIELLDGMHKPEVALLHEVEQWQLSGLVLLGNRHDEPEVGLDERLRSLVALSDRTPQLALFGNGQLLARTHFRSSCPAGLYGLCEPRLVVFCQQRVLADVVQVEADQVLLGLSGMIIRHLVRHPHTKGTHSRSLTVSQRPPSRARHQGTSSVRRYPAPVYKRGPEHK